MSDDGKHKPLHKDRQFTQAHVELVQALFLTIPASDLVTNPPEASSIQSLFDTLPKLGESFSLQRMVIMEKERSPEQKAITLIQELLRLHTQSVRNWGYFDKVLRIVLDLYKPLDKTFVDHIGVSATGIVDTFLLLVRSSEKAVHFRIDALGQVWSEKNIRGAIRKYYQLNPHFADSPTDMIEIVERKRLTLDQVRFLILAHSDFLLPDVFTFSVETIANTLNIRKENLEEVFSRLSLSFGDLASRPLEHVFLNNPVWQKPLIKLSSGQYFCALPQLFFSFIRPILDELIADHQIVQRTCEERRAEFLECEIALLFTKAFPEAEIVTSYKWRDGDAEYENDLIVRVDSHLLLIEAKSGTVSWPALRGAPDRARKHFSDLFVAPSIQSARLAERVEAVIRHPEMRESHLPNLGVRLDQVHTVLRLSVTLEDLATIQANLHTLRGTGWLPAQHKLAPCFLLSDLEIIFEMLESAGQKLHYLRRRTELAGSLKTLGDELDHLGLYLGTGFNLGDAEFSGATLQLVGMSKAVDEFCMARAEGVIASKPQCRLSQWWSQICEAVERRKFHQWSDVYSILLSMSFEDQEKVEKAFAKLKIGLRGGNLEDPVNEDTLFVIPSAPKADAIALYAFRDEDSSSRYDRMRGIASETFGHANVSRCIVVGINIDKDVYPYSTLAVFFSGDHPSFNSDELTIY
jgi:hypothetical protein